MHDERKKEEEEEKEQDGYWHYMPDIDDYMWVGSGPAPDCSNTDDVGMCDNPWNLNEEQLEEEKKEHKEYIETFMEWELKERRKENAEKLKERRKANAESVQRQREKVKARFQGPVKMPDFEMSKYELIRRKNIEEIEKMKKAIGLFDN